MTTDGPRMHVSSDAKAGSGSGSAASHRRAPAVAGALLAFFLAAACGRTSGPGAPSSTSAAGASSSTSAGNPGAGGTAQDQGGFAASTPCTTGDERQCVGPACRGGQICDSGVWSVCDCGNSVGGDAPQGLGGVGGSGPDGTIGGGADAGAQNGGTPSESADPCPVPNANLNLPPWNCASDCFEERPTDNFICGNVRFEPTPCTNYNPQEGGGNTQLFGPVTENTVLLRTPSAASVGGPCGCQTGAPIVAKLLFHVTTAGGQHIHVTVRPPLHVGLPQETVNCAPVDPAQCQDVAGFNANSFSNLQIWTEDAAAQPVNVQMAPGECPM